MQRLSLAALTLHFLLGVATIRAAYPNELTWADCGPNAKCGRLEFCQSGSSYGYRADPGAPCASPAPLVRLERGTIYKLVLRNSAAVETNLHTHGLHVVGDGDGDDITRLGGGGACLDYTWAIDADHPPGTYWYHAHPYGKTHAQVAGGAFGMLIVEDDPNEVNEWARRESERLLMVSAEVGFTGVLSFLGILGNLVFGQSFRVNGVQNEMLSVSPDRWHRFRTSIVTPSADPGDLAFGGGCTVYKVASDGVWHSARLTAYGGSSFRLTGASRADFAVRCGAGLHSISWGGTVVATIDADLEYDGMGGVAHSGDDASDLGDAPVRPSSVQDLAYVSISDFDRFEVKAGMNYVRFNGLDYGRMSGMGDIDYDRVYEMELVDSHLHSTHLHLYHMQVTTPGGCGVGHAEGEFYDTISGRSDRPCAVRFKASDFGQRMVLHCHDLGHEDSGAIDYLNVVGVPEDRQNNVVSRPYACPTWSAPADETWFASMTSSVPEAAIVSTQPAATLTYESRDEMV